jgi:hypothetical protein
MHRNQEFNNEQIYSGKAGSRFNNPTYRSGHEDFADNEFNEPQRYEARVV